MTATASTICDVFISHSTADSRLALEVADSIESVDLETFHTGTVEPAKDLGDAIWQALAESRALIVVISPDAPPHAMNMIVIGAAAAWNKPIFLLINGSSSFNLPTALRSYPAFPLNRLDDVIQQIQSGFEPLTDTDRTDLADIYRDLSIPVDQLSQSPKSLRDLTKKFNRRSNKQLSGERLLSELLRMRKRGELPRVRG